MNTRLCLLALGLLASGATPAVEAPLDLLSLSAEHTARAICEGQVSSATVVAFWLARIEARPELNAFISLAPQAALAQARAADARLAAGQGCLPLGGVPIAIKDNIQVKGFANSAGTPALAGFFPAHNAPLIDRLQAAGAIVLGKTNMHELSFGASGYNRAFHGATVGVRNAFDPSRIAGGSSSGSAAALGARLIPIAMGTDTGGSSREPCALNGCVGFRPTVGRYSGQGVTPISPRRDTPGPMANSLGDIVLLDAVLSGAPLAAATPVPASRIRLGVADFHWADLDPEVATQARAALEKLRLAGVQLVPVALPGLAELQAKVALPVVVMETRQALTAYLQEQATGVSFEALVEGIASPDVQAIFTRMIVPGRVPGPDGQLQPGAQAYQEAITRHLPALRELYRRAFADHQLDALVFPTVPEVAIKADEQASSAQHFARIIRNTDPGSQVDMPGLSLPVGLGADSGLPVAMEIDGLPGSDARLLAIGRTLESIWGPRPLPAEQRPGLGATGQ